MRKRKTTFHLYLAAALLCCLPAHAVTLLKTSDISFGMTDYATPVTGDISMGTNGVIGYTGSFSGDGLGTAAQVEIQEADGIIVEISCENGTLAHAGGSTLGVNVTAVVGTGNVTNWGSTPTCAGLGSSILTHTVGATTAQNILYLGGRLTPGALTGGVFNTSQLGGQAIQVQVIVQ